MRRLILLCTALLSAVVASARSAEVAIDVTETPLGRLPQNLLAEQIAVSPDGRRYAYVAQRGVKLVAIVDGKNSKLHDWIVRGQIAFTADSLHVIYQVRRNGKMLTVIDETEGKLHDSVDDPVRSSSGGHVGYVARRGNKFLAVIDGIESKPYDNVRIAALGSAAQSVLVVEIAGKDCLVVNSVEGRMFPRIVDARLSPDGKRHAARVLRDENSAAMVVDGNPGKPFTLTDGASAVEPAVFSPDGAHVGYLAATLNGRILIIDDAEIPTPAGRPLAGPFFSPDSKRLAYVVAKPADSAAVVLDDAVGKTYHSVSQLRFSPDGKRLAYVATLASRTILVIDNAEIGQYQTVAPNSLAFSRDGQHVAWVARRADKEFVVIDGVEAKPFDRILAWEGLQFDQEGAVHTIATSGRDLLALTISPATR